MEREKGIPGQQGRATKNMNTIEIFTPKRIFNFTQIHLLVFFVCVCLSKLDNLEQL